MQRRASTSAGAGQERLCPPAWGPAQTRPCLPPGLPPCAGLLTSGLIPSVRHALGSLLTTDAILLPASATLYCQAVEFRTGEVCGLDMSAANQYRWHPAYAAGECHGRLMGWPAALALGVARAWASSRAVPCCLKLHGKARRLQRRAGLGGPPRLEDAAPFLPCRTPQALALALQACH